VAYFLDHKIASEAAGCLDDDGSNPIALDPHQHGREAGAAILPKLSRFWERFFRALKVERKSAQHFRPDDPCQ
jgi:hypothetical protein